MKNQKSYNPVFWLQKILFALIMLLTYTCSLHQEKPAEEKIESKADIPIPLDDYKVVLAVDEIIKIHEKGELRVWIGAKAVMPIFPEGMVKDQTAIPGSIGQYARITPYAPDFHVEPASYKCIKIHPSGSDVPFTLIPKEYGKFKVSAFIELFENFDCTGTPVPKTAATLTVEVKVDTKHVIVKKIEELAIIFWDKFITFWGALITLLFAFILYLIRRKIKRRTGFEEKKE